MKRNFSLIFSSDRVKEVVRDGRRISPMKKILTAMIAIALLMGLSASAYAETPGIILVTVYEQMGWGDAISVGFVDQNVGLWTLEGSASALEWPHAPEKQIAYLLRTEQKVQVGKLLPDDTFDLKGLIECAEMRQPEPQGWACDAGTQRSYAVLNRDSGTEIMMLGITGDGYVGEYGRERTGVVCASVQAFPRGAVLCGHVCGNDRRILGIHPGQAPGLPAGGLGGPG